MLQSGLHTSIASHPAPPLWKQGWSYCRFQRGDKAVWAQPLDVALWAGAALQGQAEQRRKERLTEASKSTPDEEAATRRALHQGGCWGQGCSGRWMKKRCYGIYHGIYVYIYISFNIPWCIPSIPWYVLHNIWYIAHCVWYIPYLVYLGIYHPYIPCHISRYIPWYIPYHKW
jgi:hypothetical protein